MPEQTSACIAWHRHAAEVRTVNVRDAVVPGEPLVHERVVRIQEVEHRSILAHDALEEHLRFALETLAQVVVEVGEHRDIGVGVLQIAKIEPLVREVGDERARFRIGEHAARLLLEHGGLVQLAIDRQLQQLIVRDRRPEEEGEA